MSLARWLLRARPAQVVRPGRQADSALIDALVREYLEYNSCRHTAAVFAAGACVRACVRVRAPPRARERAAAHAERSCRPSETGRRDDAPEFSRDALTAQLRFADTTASAQVPLLYALVAEARAGRRVDEGGAARGASAAAARAAAAPAGTPASLMTFTN